MNRVLLTIVIHSLLILDNPCLSYFLMDVETREILITERLPLSQGAFLTWVGFSEYGVRYFKLIARLL